MRRWLALGIFGCVLAACGGEESERRESDADSAIDVASEDAEDAIAESPADVGSDGSADAALGDANSGAGADTSVDAASDAPLEVSDAAPDARPDADASGPLDADAPDVGGGPVATGWCSGADCRTPRCEAGPWEALLPLPYPEGVSGAFFADDAARVRVGEGQAERYVTRDSDDGLYVQRWTGSTWVLEGTWDDIARLIGVWDLEDDGVDAVFAVTTEGDMVELSPGDPWTRRTLPSMLPALVLAHAPDGTVHTLSASANRPERCTLMGDQLSACRTLIDEELDPGARYDRWLMERVELLDGSQAHLVARASETDIRVRWFGLNGDEPLGDVTLPIGRVHSVHQSRDGALVFLATGPPHALGHLPAPWTDAGAFTAVATSHAADAIAESAAVSRVVFRTEGVASYYSIPLDELLAGASLDAPTAATQAMVGRSYYGIDATTLDLDGDGDEDVLIDQAMGAWVYEHTDVGFQGAGRVPLELVDVGVAGEIAIGPAQLFDASTRRVFGFPGLETQLDSEHGLSAIDLSAPPNTLGSCTSVRGFGYCFGGSQSAGPHVRFAAGDTLSDARPIAALAPIVGTGGLVSGFSSDFDRDGQSELMVSMSAANAARVAPDTNVEGPNALVVFRVLTDGQLELLHTIGVDSFGDVADIDGDGTEELLFLQEQAVEVFDIGEAGLALRERIELGEGVNLAGAHYWRDADGDGDADLFTHGVESGEVYGSRNDGASFGPSARILDGAGATTFREPAWGVRSGTGLTFFDIETPNGLFEARDVANTYTLIRAWHDGEQWRQEERLRSRTFFWPMGVFDVNEDGVADLVTYSLSAGISVAFGRCADEP